VTEAFRDSQHRVKSMALVHEKLYQSEDMVSVDFADYIKNLAGYLFHSYSLDDGKVSLKLDVEKVFLGMDTAVPLGIIVNELVSNSLKHAFPEGKTGGRISVCLKREEAEKQSLEKALPGAGSNRNLENGDANKVKTGNPVEWFSLVVADNGAGFPEGIDFRETDSLGLQLVTNLVDQIEGSIELNTGKGTEFRIRFKELRSKTKG
ncbi:sensor histidine kinase, partial [Methanosarcina sp.]|uniref:sensor histidine kinase n=1 Tax=Methanosarcina sp. TaxID=2213 RepID=UPI003C753BE5